MGAPLKDKIQIFFFGLMAGLLIGACFFIFKLDSYFKELSFYKSDSKKNIIKEIITPVEQENKKNETKSTKPVSKNYSKSGSTQEITDTITLVRNKVFSGDSTLADSAKSTYNEEIVIRKDELVSTKSVELQNITSSKDNAVLASDTLSNKISGVKKDVPVSQYKVEYWMSPLNYRGYKLHKNKIILYGINPAENISLYKLDGVVYCKNSLLVYRLDYSPEFRYFEIVTDESLLAKIK